MNNAPTAAAIAAYQQRIVNNHQAPFVSVRTLPGTQRIRHVRQSDFALKILFEEMTRSNLSRKDIEDMYNYALAPHYTNFGRRTYYALNDRFRNRHRPGREHENWNIVDLRWSRLSAAAQVEKQSVLASLCAAARAMGIAIDRRDAQGGAALANPVAGNANAGAAVPSAQPANIPPIAPPAIAAPLLHPSAVALSAHPPVPAAPPSAHPPVPAAPPSVHPPVPAAPPSVHPPPPPPPPAAGASVHPVHPPVVVPTAPQSTAPPLLPAGTGSSQIHGLPALPGNTSQPMSTDDAQSADHRSSEQNINQNGVQQGNIDWIDNRMDNNLPGIQYHHYLPSLANHPVQPAMLNAFPNMPDLSLNPQPDLQPNLQAPGNLHHHLLTANNDHEHLVPVYVNLRQPVIAPHFDANGDPMGHYTDHNLTLYLIQNALMLMYANLLDDNAQDVILRYAGYLDAIIAELDLQYQRLCPWLEALRLAQYWIGN
ncbi:hypothetical protein AMS68_002254 [Peltaster fructicola]|uniref:Uncharacterized protein n=1 Tax=Peltaster fructicola TaxID=286661 RepID=A0A6H0XPP6_9PEZI|nr:hypothetical protein AMS68_002254 [Peltaster fructicola]